MKGEVELRRIRAAGWEPGYRPDDRIPLGARKVAVLTWARRPHDIAEWPGEYTYARGEGPTRLAALRDLMRSVGG